MPSSSGIIALPALQRHTAPFSTAKTAHLLMPKEMETYHICIHKFIGKMPENVNSGKVIVCAVEGCQKAHISSDILNWNQRDSISLAFVNEARKRGFDGIVMCYSFSH